MDTQLKTRTFKNFTFSVHAQRIVTKIEKYAMRPLQGEWARIRESVDWDFLGVTLGFIRFLIHIAFQKVAFLF